MSTPYDPYQPPAPVEPKPSMPAPGSGGLQYMYIYNYVFENPNWKTNVLYAMVCMLIPVIGPLVFMGYQFEMIESMLRQPGRTYPDFDFGKFSNYLVRGLWPFLASMIVSLPFGFVMGMFYVVMVVLIGVISAAAGKDAGPVVLLVAFPIEFITMFTLQIAMQLVVTPFVIRAGLCQDFGQTFNFGWAMSFLKKTWSSMLLFELFFFVTAMPLAMIGLLVCCIGIYPVAGFLVLARANLLLQLYNLFLARGGEPVPFKEQPPGPSAAYAS